MDRKYIDDNDVISRYLNGRLKEQELTAFETFMIAHSDVAKEVELELSLQNSLRQQLTPTEVTSAPVAHSAVLDHSDVDMAVLAATAAHRPPVQTYRSFPLGLAASALAIAGLSFGALTYRNAAALKNENASLRAPQTVQGVFQFEKNKSTVAAQQVIMANSPAMLWLDVGPEQYPHYATQITAESGEVIWREDAPVLMDNFSIGVFVQGLKAGRYTIAVSATDASGKAVDVATYHVVASR